MKEIRVLLIDSESGDAEIESVIHRNLTKEQACNMLDDIKTEFKNMHVLDS